MDHLGDCLAQCDDEGKGCLGMLAEYDADDESKIGRCFTVGDGDYTPAEVMTDAKIKRKLKMFVKTSNVDAEMRQVKAKNNRLDRNQNSFMSLLKFVKDYERQERLAHLFSSL